MHACVLMKCCTLLLYKLSYNLTYKPKEDFQKKIRKESGKAI